MSTYCKTILIACFIALPSFAFAADNPVEATPVVGITPVETAVKPAGTSQSPRIGYVDIIRIGSESERGRAVKALLTAKKNALQEKADGKKKQFEKFKTATEGKIATMTPAQRDAKAKEFQKKMEELQKFARASEEEFYLLQEQETKALYEAIEQAAVAHGKANGFAAIVIKKELLYIGSSADTKDVTDDLVKALNQADQKK
ncbi:MAG TPA: OmpH family outer membrane protein [Desulfuromonadales bacterium]|nr:OmpH family outer membrane protein [Desulfuromonadales bacterium]